MRIRGKRLAWLGWPIGVALAVVTAAVLMAPRPVRPDTSAVDPTASASSQAGGVALSSAGASSTGVADATAGSASSHPANPSSDPTEAGLTAPPLGTPLPTLGPAITPTAGPTAGPTLHPTAHPTSPPPPTAGPTTAPTVPPATAGPVPPLSACPVFPSSNVWNRRVDSLPVAGNSAMMIAAIGLGSSLHPDFSDAGGYGIPFNVVGTSTPRSNVSFQYDDESDPVGYPIPASPKIESGSDRHILMIDTNDCVLYELFAADHGTNGWHAGSGAVWDLGSNALRPAGWTSADAAGLPILPGLVRWSEVSAGAIHHAIRFTAPDTCNGYIYPARHEAGDGSCSVNPPMGLRVRLKASVDISGFGPQARIVLTALKQYGMLLADNGSPWYITGAPDSHWNDDELHDLGQIEGADFEVVDTSGFVNG